MHLEPRRVALVAVGLVGLFGGCRAPVGTTHVTSATLSNDSAVVQVARVRCRRLAECNQFGGGHAFANQAQCIRASEDMMNDLAGMPACPNGVDRDRLNACLASLAVEACDPDPGPVTAMNGCNSYCVK